MTAHFRTNAQASVLFDRHSKRGAVDAAVRSVIGLGMFLRREDVLTPRLDAMNAMPPEARHAYALHHAPEVSAERRALHMLLNQESLIAEQAAAAAKAKATERAAWVIARASELEAEWQAERLAKWTAQAETEAVAKFDALALRAPSEPTRTGKRGAAILAEREGT
jgi:hypothetical protein